MRIISGKFKGRRFKASSKIPARPTTDYAKESLFNILQQEISWPETRFLDLFAGIGSISFEAISRGANQIVSVDNNKNAIQWINQQLDILNEQGHSAIQADAIKWLSQSNARFDAVFADPPYAFEKYDELISLVISQALANHGLFILEHRQNINFEEHSNFVKDRTYGEVKFTFFKSN